MLRKFLVPPVGAALALTVSVAAHANCSPGTVTPAEYNAVQVGDTKIATETEFGAHGKLVKFRSTDTDAWKYKSYPSSVDGEYVTVTFHQVGDGAYRVQNKGVWRTID